MRSAFSYGFFALLIATTWSSEASATLSPATPQPVVRVVLFWMESCGHCHYVLEEVLPPLQERYGDSLEILLLELKSAQDVNRLYQTAVALGLPKDEVAVPFLVIGDRVLIGAEQIPDELPGLIEQYLSGGGVDYPDLLPLAPVLPDRNLEEASACLPSTPCATQAADPAATPSPALTAAGPPPKAGSDPGSNPPLSNGFSLAIAILGGMLAAVSYSGYVFWHGAENSTPQRGRDLFELSVPLLALAGLGVASYLAYVETQAVAAVCGPVGDCNAVQSSSYARLFGLVPVGVLGLAGYLAILLAWAWRRLHPSGLARYAPAAIFVMAIFGTLFSIYLTYLEPFVIRAVCIWCLTSAVLITLLLLVSVRPAVESMEGEDKAASAY